MIDKKRALYLTEEAFDKEEPALVCGISVEAAIQILSKERLPNSSFPISELGDRLYSNYLVGIPKKKSFINHPLHNQIQIDLEGNVLEDEVKYYAEEEEQLAFLKNFLGYWPLKVSPMEIPGNYTFDELEKRGVDVNKIFEFGLYKLRKEVEKRR